MTRCRLIHDPPAEGCWNMAVDQVLLEAATAGQTTLRCYAWAQPTLSLGYFQSVDDRLQHAASQSCRLVRRHSGGGAILHHHELTYSFATPSAPRLNQDPLRLYRIFHQSLVEALAHREISARLCSVAVESAGPPPFLCFQRHTAGDVLLGAHKVAGSASGAIAPPCCNTAASFSNARPSPPNCQESVNWRWPACRPQPWPPIGSSSWRAKGALSWSQAVSRRQNGSVLHS